MAMFFLVLVFPSSVLPFHQQSQRAEAAATNSSPSSSYSAQIPPAYVIVDGKRSKLQLENDPFADNLHPRIADYSKPSQGTVSFGEQFTLFVPQSPNAYKDVKGAKLWINTDSANSNDDFHVRMDRLKVRDTSFAYLETYAINAPVAVGDGFTASDKGLRIFLWWDVSFTDGRHQTYVAILILKGDPCQEHGWDYQPTDDRKCVDLDA
ncbi:MAG: hypothetical protein M3247_03785 [Thermoproteota archaeon]|nr:hypothetical protein [Thermoproteota archaeon]